MSRSYFFFFFFYKLLCKRHVGPPLAALETLDGKRSTPFYFHVVVVFLLKISADGIGSITDIPSSQGKKIFLLSSQKRGLESHIW
jgi:hypothetical protein